MTNEVRFGWIGASRRSALRVLLADLVNEWARAWWLTSAFNDIDISDATAAPEYTRRGTPLVASGEEGTVVVDLCDASTGSIGRCLAATLDDQGDGLARRIGEAALSDLTMRVQRRAGCRKPLELALAEAPVGMRDARLGAFAFDMSLGPLSWRVTIDRRIADKLVAPGRSRGASLSPRRDALERVPVSLRAVMDFGSVDLAHLADLCVGEILVGEHKLEDALQVHLEGQGVVAKGYLRRLGEQRAITVGSANMQDKHTS